MSLSPSMTPQQIQEQIAALGPWFYEFDLGDGLRTNSQLPPQVRAIFETRLAMVNRVVKSHFGERLSEIQCIDVGCHEGFYSMAMAALGVPRVVGVDVRDNNLAKARFVAAAKGHSGIEFQAGNCEEISADKLGCFDLSLFLGILYHLENPMRCLRNISALTDELCLIETQVVDEVVGSTEWGSREWTRPYRGVLALIDESDEFLADNTETGASPVAACPSPAALIFMLKQAGFARVELIEPPPNAYEQHRRGKRVVCAAYK